MVVSVSDYKMTFDLLFSTKTDATRKLKSSLESMYYSIICDHWTFTAQENYEALTLHLIDDFELKTFILICRKYPNGASATELEIQLTSDFTSWGLEKTLLLFYCY
jgi:chromosomal replication initiation ATPase DnaA